MDLDNNLKLSIVTITMNDPTNLDLTLASTVTSLTNNPDFEQIVVDGSPEANKMVLDKYRKLQNFVHIHDNPAGIYAALNAGITASQGEYVWLLNSGDCLLSENALNKAIELLDNIPGTDVLVCAVDRIRRGEYRYTCFPTDHFLKAIIGGCVTWIHQGMIYRRTLFDQVGLFDVSFKVSGDHEHHWRCYTQRKSFVVSHIRLAKFDSDGMSSVNYKLGYIEHRRVHRMYAPKLKIYIEIANELTRAFLYYRTAAIRWLKSTTIFPLIDPIMMKLKRLKSDR